MKFFDPNFKNNKSKYIVQSLLAGISVAAALFLFDIGTRPVIVAAFGASAFIAFTLPHKVISTPRHLIGGYLIGILVGSFLDYFTDIPIKNPDLQYAVFILCAILAVGLAMFLMAITNTEHAPATSVALGLVLHEGTFKVLILLMAGICIIALLNRALKSWMVDLGG